MANITESGQRSSFLPSLVTVAELKAFLAENDLPTTGRKQELQERVVNLLETEDLLYAIEAAALVDLKIPAAPIFGDLPADGWTSEEHSVISKQLVKDYLCSVLLAPRPCNFANMNKINKCTNSIATS